jgi:hypothetical protein
MTDILKVAQDFASCMDNDDFSKAKTFLANNCKYYIQDNFFNTPEAIIATYKEHSDYAKSTFDSVIYKSQIQQISPLEFEAIYIDIISKNGKSHNYQCKQIINFDQSFRIIRIQHVEIPGEHERILNFYSEIGLK